MKAKRFLSLMLSLTLAASLAAPALAAEETPPLPEPTAEEFQSEEPVTWRNLWYSDIYDQVMEEFKASHQAEYETFDADAVFQEMYGGYWDKNEYMELFEEDEESFKEDMWSEYMSDQVDRQVEQLYNARLIQLYEEAFPGELESLSTEEMLAQQGYLDPVSAYMEDRGLESPEAVRESLLADYIYSRQEAADRHDQAEAYRTEDPESWESFDADAYFAEEWSWYTKEEFMSGWRDLRTEEDFKEYLYIEYMEGKIGYPNWWEDRDYPLSLVVNGFDYAAELTAVDGVTYAPPEVVNAILGTHYTDAQVPLRAAAVEEGWDVVWNQYTNDVVLLDRELLLKGIYADDETLASVDEMDEWGYEGMGQKLLSLMGELDGNMIYQDFSKFDEMMTRAISAVEWEPGQSYRTTETMDITLTTLNSLDGDKEYPFTVQLDAVTRDNVVDLTVSANVVQLLDLLGKPALDQLAAEMPKVTYQNLKTLLTGCKAEVILDGDEGKLYWNVPILALFDDTVGENDWFCVDLSLGEENETVAAVTEAITAGKWDTAALAYSLLLDGCENDSWGAVSAYGDYAMMRMALNLLVGKDTITEQNGTLTWRLDAQRIDDLMTMADPYMGDSSVEELFRELEVTVSVDRNGKQTASAVVRPNMDAIAAENAYWLDPLGTAAMSWVMNLFDFRAAAQSSGTTDKATGTAEFHWKNQLKLKLDTATTRQAVKEAPRTAPPAGAEIVEL